MKQYKIGEHWIEKYFFILQRPGHGLDHKSTTRSPRAAYGPPGCIKRPVTTIVNCVYSIKITQNLRRLGRPLSVILPCAACEPAHDKSVTLCHKKSGDPCRRPVFLNRRATTRYRALASIIPGREGPKETTICYKISLVQLITNLNVILYLSTCHNVYISVLILFMIMP